MAGACIEVATATNRTPREVRRQESVRTLFLTWILNEQARMRPIMIAMNTLSSAFAGADGSTSGGAASRASAKVREAARRGAKIAKGGEFVNGKFRIHIDDPGAAAAFGGHHPSLVNHRNKTVASRARSKYRSKPRKRR